MESHQETQSSRRPALEARASSSWEPEDDTDETRTDPRRQGMEPRRLGLLNTQAPGSAGSLEAPCGFGVEGPKNLRARPPDQDRR